MIIRQPKQKSLTENEIKEEMVKYLQILLFHKCDKEDEERIKNHLRKNLEELSKVRIEKERKLEERKAKAYARKFGVKVQKR